MATLDPPDQFPTKVYAGRERTNLVGHLQTALRVTNKNLYGMVEIVCVFSKPFYIEDARENIVPQDDEALEPGDFFIISDGSVLPTPEAPLTPPRPVTKQTGSLRIQSFCDEVRERDRGCVLSGLKVDNPHLGDWDMFEACHIFPLALESYWEAYEFTPELFALPPRERDHPINSVQNGLLLTRNAHCLWDRYRVSINPEDNYTIAVFTSKVLDYLNPRTRPREEWLDDDLRPIDSLLSWHYRQCVLTHFKVSR